MACEVVGAREEHVFGMISRLRQSDREEVLAATGENPAMALWHSYERSFFRWTLVKDEQPIAMFGAAPLTLVSKKGIVWMLGTDEVETVSATAARATKRRLKTCLKEFVSLENWVDARNEVSIRWLEWSGFKMGEPTPYGVSGKLFRHFHMDRG